MGMVPILVIWSRPHELSFISQSQKDFIWNLASIGSVVSENKKCENVDMQDYLAILSLWQI